MREIARATEKGKTLERPIWALGTMSGTSLDGVDGAMVLTDGEEITEFGPSAYARYCDAERATLRAGLGRWPGEAGVEAAAAAVEARTAQVCAPFEMAEIVGFHGQTLAHAPREGRTHQAGDGARLASALSVPVVWDFRSADVALGGEGAPLAPIFHAACVRWVGASAPIAVLNLGGVGNMTWIDPKTGELMAFDTGPANAPLNDLVNAAGVGDFDVDGAGALSGRVDQSALSAALHHSYYARLPPKSLDRDELRSSLSPIWDLPLRDALATATALIGETVALGMRHCPKAPSALWVTGGGRNNPAIMAALAARLSTKVVAIESVGLDGDMLEAQAFAYLAVRVKRGLPTSFPTTTGVGAAVGGGQISYPPVV